MGQDETIHGIQELLESARIFLMEQGVEFAISVITALIIFILGKWAVKKVNKLFVGFLSRSDVDETLISFVSSITYTLLLCMIVITALGQLGVKTSSLIAILGAAGLAIGLALKDSLSNFAAGAMIIAFRPFQKGDFIEAAGSSGVVHDLKVLTTTLKTADNKVLIIPNSGVFGGTIVNYSREKTRRVDMTFGIGYGDDIKKAKDLLVSVLENDERVLKDPAPLVAVSELADSSVNFTVRPWVNSADYWGVFFDTHEKVKYAFDEAGISIPFPQTDIHLHQADQVN